MRSYDDDDVDCGVMRLTRTTAVNYSDDEILRDSSAPPPVDDLPDPAVDAVPPRRNSAGCGGAGSFAPFSRLDVEHHPLSGGHLYDDDDRGGIGAAAAWSCDRGGDDEADRRARTVDVPSYVESFPRTTTRAADDRGAAISTWSRDPDSYDCRRRFIDERLARYKQRPATATSLVSSSTTVSRLPSTTFLPERSEFVVCRRDADRSSSTTSSSSSSSPAARLLRRLGPQSSPPAVPSAQRPPPTTLRARKREPSARSAASGRLRRSNSVAGPRAAAGDEGFADGRTRTPEPRRRASGGGGGEGAAGGEPCCLCREADCRRVQGSSQHSVASSTSDQTRKRSYRVGLNLFNK